MFRYLLIVTASLERVELGELADDIEAEICTTAMLEDRGHALDDLVTGDWQQGRMLVWANEGDAKDDPGAKALASVNREHLDGTPAEL